MWLCIRRELMKTRVYINSFFLFTWFHSFSRLCKTAVVQSAF